jgi:hypothetical protein
VNDDFLGFVRNRDLLLALGTRPLFSGEFIADREPGKATWTGDWDWHIELGCLEQ